MKDNHGVNQNLVFEISKIKDKAKRSLELDREKVYKRAIDELIYNDEKNSILFSGNDLKISEKVALCHSLASYGDDEWIAEDFGVDRSEYRRNRLKIMNENFTDQFLFKVLRRHLKSSLVTLGNLDFGMNEDPAADFNIVKDYFPSEIKLFTEEQNDVALKIIERYNARIVALENT